MAIGVEGLVMPEAVGRPERGRARPRRMTAVGLVSPAAFLVGALVVWPVVRTVQLGLAAGGQLGEVVVGAEARAFWLTLVWVVVLPFVVTGLGLLFALAARRRPPDETLRPALLVPFALPLVVTAVAFRFIYDPDQERGLANQLVEAVPGVDPPTWLAGPFWINVALMSAFVWAWVGLAVVVFRSALKRVRQATVDTIRVLGGSRWLVLRKAYLPALQGPGSLVLALVALATTRAFDLILVMSPGSSLEHSAVLPVRLWQTGGSDAALGLVWLLMVLVPGLFVVGLVVHAQLSPPAGQLPADPSEPALTMPAGERQSPRPVDAKDAKDAKDASRLPSVARFLRLWGFRIVWFLPVVAVVATSLHEPQTAGTEPWWVVDRIGLGSYGETVSGSPLVRSLFLTFGLTLAATLLVLVLSLAAAHGLGRLNRKARAVVFGGLAVAAMVPVLAVLGPLADVLSVLHLRGGVIGLLAVHVAFGLPFATLILRIGMDALSDDVLVVARMGPVSRWSLVRDVAMLWKLRLDLWPAIAVVVVLQLVQVWNDFVVALLFTAPELLAGGGNDLIGDATPLGLLVFGESRQVAANSGPLAVTAVLMAAPPVLLLLRAGRQVRDSLVPKNVHDAVKAGPGRGWGSSDA